MTLTRKKSKKVHLSAQSYATQRQLGINYPPMTDHEKALVTSCKGNPQRWLSNFCFSDLSVSAKRYLAHKWASNLIAQDKKNQQEEQQSRAKAKEERLQRWATLRADNSQSSERSSRVPSLSNIETHSKEQSPNKGPKEELYSQHYKLVTGKI